MRPKQHPTGRAVSPSAGTPTRTDEKDTGAWNWGGTLIVHEIIQERDGSLTVNLPAEIASQLTEILPAQMNHESDAGRSRRIA